MPLCSVTLMSEHGQQMHWMGPNPTQGRRITSIDGSGFVTVEYADGISAGTTRTVESGIFVSRINMDVGGPPVVVILVQ